MKLYEIECNSINSLKVFENEKESERIISFHSFLVCIYSSFFLTSVQSNLLIIETFQFQMKRPF